jgi:transcriptional regulator of acetoin/glycerol metabolism
MAETGDGQLEALQDAAARLSKRAVLARQRTGLPAHELVGSWQRSVAAIGDPGRVRSVPHVPEEILDEHLLDMVRAPMDVFAGDLKGTGLALLLADSSGQILQRWAGDAGAARHLDRVGTVRGAVLSEDQVGTNGVGTAVALQKPVQIRGDEHFADFYQDAVCTSSPVLHPVTNSLVAVMTLSSDVRNDPGLLMPLVRALSRQLEAHLLSVEKPASIEMLNLFMELSRRGRAPVIALGPQGSVLQSDNARRLSPQDLDALRALSDEGRPTGRYVVELSDGPVRLELVSVGRSTSVVTLGSQESARPAGAGSAPPRVRLGGSSREWTRLVQQVERLRQEPGTAIIAGEPGVGKTSLALGFPFRLNAGAAPDYVHEGAARHIQGLEAWLAALEASVRTHSRLIVRGIDALDAPALRALRTIIEGREQAPQVLLTMTAQAPDVTAQLENHFGAAAAWVTPLRERPDDVAEVWSVLADAIAPRAGLRLGPETLTLMQRYNWPGNVKEMRRLVTRLAEIGRTGEVQPGELPATMQNAKHLSMMERAELEAIRRALSEAEGNRMKAADILGISRATVYRKMKTYKLNDH